ncbi:hypothetical protein LCGC14_1931320 [marine sediment metagenome]|uniref:Uncharacterized protein n=1 Tax=marine sediment metagenome TaxID=412755 RepID=A0A0F9FNJ2_9ZZZZ
MLDGADPFIVRGGVPRTIEAIALDITSRLRISHRQFDVVCRMLRTADDPEKKAKELNATPISDLLKLIGEKTH